MSWIRGREILPSGRTGTSRVRSMSLQTETSSTSSIPILYSSSAARTAVALPVIFLSELFTGMSSGGGFRLASVAETNPPGGVRSAITTRQVTSTRLASGRVTNMKCGSTRAAALSSKGMGEKRTRHILQPILRASRRKLAGQSAAAHLTWNRGPVEAAVLNGLRDVPLLDALRGRQMRDGPGHAQHRVVRPGRQPQQLNGLVQDPPRSVADPDRGPLHHPLP